MTNFEKITKSPEELAKVIGEDNCPVGLGITQCIGNCEKCWLDWLNKEAESEAGNE